MLISGIFVVVAVSLTAVVGMVVRTLNPTLEASQAVPWLMMNYVPPFVTMVVFTLVLAAAMSSADSNLNAASVILVNDLIRPFARDLSDKQLVMAARLLTLVVGIFAALAAIYASSIIGLFAKAYTMAGGGVVPVLLVGLLWKRDYSQPFKMGTRNSKVTPWGARVGLVVGAVVSMTVGILWGVAVSALSTIVVSVLTQEKEQVKPGVAA